MPGQALAQDPQSKGWSAGIFGEKTTLMIGGGGSVKPEYEGGKKLSLSPVPLVELDGLFGGHVFVSTFRGVGIDFLTQGPLKFSTSVNYSGGRDSDDSDHLRGMDDIDGGVKVSAALRYDFAPFSATAEVSHRFGDASGTTLTLGAAYGFSPLPDLRLSLGTEVKLADRTYENSFFGVTAEEAARAAAAGNPLRAYKAGAGVQDVGLKLAGTYNIGKHWLVRSEIGVGLLVGDAADSPLTERKLQPSAFLGMAYRF